MEKIIVIANRGDLSPALLASRVFYEMRQENGKPIDILCLSPKKSLFSWHSDAEKMKKILMTMGIGEPHLKIREENSFEDCILYTLQDDDCTNAIWCLPATMSLLLRRRALQREISLTSQQVKEDFRLLLPKNKKEREKKIRTFGLQLIADKLIGPGDYIFGRMLHTGITWDNGRPTFKMAEKPYGIQ